MNTFMSRTSLALALLASVATVVVPVTSASAQSAVPMPRSKPALQKHPSTQPAATVDASRAIEMAVRGEASILTPEQMDDLSKSSPRLHAKLLAASHSGTLPNLSREEQKLLKAKTLQTLEAFKAGNGLPISTGRCREGLVVSTGVFVVGCIASAVVGVTLWPAVLGGVGMVAFGSLLKNRGAAFQAAKTRNRDLLTSLYTLRNQLAATASAADIAKVDGLIARALADDAALGQMIADDIAGR